MKWNVLAVLAGSILLWTSAVASAQTRTTGAVRGMVIDQQSGQPVAGATVVVTSPALQGTQAEITDGDGRYYITNLPPGEYRLTVYYADAEFTRGNVLIQLGRVALINMEIDTLATTGEVIEIEGRVPVIDQGSTKTGRTITEDYTRNIPTGRTFGSVIETAAGAQGDLYGFSFGGSTSAENVYIIEGLNTTNPAFGLQSTNLPNEFIQETEVITGGYNAEYGRSTGGVINVLTKSGGNELEGMVYTYLTPGVLRAAEVPTPLAGSAIERRDALDYDFSVGATLGGPIVRDRLWFHVGLNPSYNRYAVHRIINTRVDEDGDGRPDRDPRTGFLVLEEVGRSTASRASRTTFFAAKLSGAVSPEHQGAVSFFGNPRSGDSIASVTGEARAGRLWVQSGAWDTTGKWTSKLFDNRTELNAVLGWHRNVNRSAPALPGGDDTRYMISTVQPFSAFEWYEREMGLGIPDACRDAAAGWDQDPYPGIINCPVQNYRIGGVGYHERQTMDRLAGLLTLTQRVNALGNHIFKAGLDSEYQIYDRLARYSGGESYRLMPDAERGSSWQIARLYRFIGGAPEICVVEDLDEDPTTPDQIAAACEYMRDGLHATTRTRNLAAFVQDSWQILPNLTVDLGLRWEQQSLLAADQVAGRVSPLTGETIDEVAFRISDMFAPRLGIIYDPTREGRAKLFSHWGRFYESLPMGINARAFGGEVTNINLVGASHCQPDLEGRPVAECALEDAHKREYIGAGGVRVAPGLGGQYMDEVVVGAEYELLNDLKVGASLVRRSVGRVIEDVSPNDGRTFIIANPGEVDERAIERLRWEGRADEAELFAGVAGFDMPVRRYDALQLTAVRRFSINMQVDASYTLSRTYGNFPGLFSPDSGQLDPNLTSMYDLPGLMSNRMGLLPADRTHQLKLDGYYIFDMAQAGFVVLGAGLRAESGTPLNYLGAHPTYGSRETYILPRGRAGRSPMTGAAAVRLQYGRQLRQDTRLAVFLDVANLLNQQLVTAVDEEYTEHYVNPIVGGDQDDLEHIKRHTIREGGKQYSTPLIASQKPNFGNPTGRQSPLRVQLGLRLTF